MAISIFGFDKSRMPSTDETLVGRDQPIKTALTHYVNGRSLQEAWQAPLKTIQFGMGCFWGAERLFWSLPGVYVTAVGYAGGTTPNPTYDEVCSGRTGHTEVVLVVYDSNVITLEVLLKTFWEGHNPTQYMRQGNDFGTNYRSAIYVDNSEDYDVALASRAAYGAALLDHGQGEIVTEIVKNQPFYYAEAAHQQYLAKNPNGYCGLAGTGIACPVGLNISS